MEALVLVLVRGLTTEAINPNSLPIVSGCLANPLNRSLQIMMELSHDRPANIVAQIPWTNEQDVDTRDLGYFLDLLLSAFAIHHSCTAESIHLQEPP